jgi:hypothetical protein
VTSVLARQSLDHEEQTLGELGRYGIFGRAAGLAPERALAGPLGCGTVRQGGSPPGDLADVKAVLGRNEHHQAGGPDKVFGPR